VADKLNSAPKYVISSTLENPDWNNTTLIKGNIPEEIAKLKQGPGGNIAILGSAALVQSLMGCELIDEYQLMVHPIALGSGKRLFPKGINLPLRLVEAKAFSSGVLLLRYQPDGK
jgi:dihydrofolate reductase